MAILVGGLEDVRRALLRVLPTLVLQIYQYIQRSAIHINWKRCHRVHCPAQPGARLLIELLKINRDPNVIRIAFTCNSRACVALSATPSISFVARLIDISLILASQ